MMRLYFELYDSESNYFPDSRVILWKGERGRGGGGDLGRFA